MPPNTTFISFGCIGGYRYLAPSGLVQLIWELLIFPSLRVVQWCSELLIFISLGCLAELGIIEI